MKIFATIILSLIFLFILTYVIYSVSKNDCVKAINNLHKGTTNSNLSFDGIDLWRSGDKINVLIISYKVTTDVPWMRLHHARWSLFPFRKIDMSLTYG